MPDRGVVPAASIRALEQRPTAGQSPPSPTMHHLTDRSAWQDLLDLLTGRTAAQREKDRLRPPDAITGVRG